MPDKIENITSFYEKQLFQKLFVVDRQATLLYNRFIRRAAPILQRYLYTDKGILLQDPYLDKLIKKELTVFAQEFERYLEGNITQTWNMSHEKTSQMLKGYLSSTAINKLSEKGLFSRNAEALDQFIKRKINGMNLSQRIWNLAEDTRLQLEFYLETGLSTGRSAEEISRDVRQILRDPETRFRRIRDPKTGKLIESKPMANYHPGRGKYRSAHKNAVRLARNEINLAYREADMTRWQSIDFVLGYEVKLSNRHPEIDVCDYAIGKYPKTFIFNGFHVNCICYAVPIMPDDDQFFDFLVNEDKSKLEYIKEVPQGLKGWLKDHREQLSQWKTQPYFIQRNQDIVNKIYKEK